MGLSALEGEEAMEGGRGGGRGGVCSPIIDLESQGANGGFSGNYSLLSLSNNDVQYDNTRCSLLCCVEEFK